MAEEGTPEILAEQRLGHQVPGMRGLYTHVSERMRAELMQALQARWQEALQERAALNPRSPVPLLDKLLAAKTDTGAGVERATAADAARSLAPRSTRRHCTTRGNREKMISQIPPNPLKHRTRRLNKKEREERLTWSGNHIR
jgi:hypothetical protein